MFWQMCFSGPRGICKGWEETEAKLERDVHRGLWWDACRAAETDGGDGEACWSLQGPVSSEELC